MGRKVMLVPKETVGRLAHKGQWDQEVYEEWLDLTDLRVNREVHFKSTGNSVCGLEVIKKTLGLYRLILINLMWYHNRKIATVGRNVVLQRKLEFPLCVWLTLET